MEALAFGCADATSDVDDLRRSFCQSLPQVNARGGDIEVF
jgi:hypothetical protein